MYLSSVSIFLSALFIKLALSGYEECGYHFSESSVTFDLSPLTLTSASSMDYYSVPTGDYIFAFNLCSDVLNPSSIHSRCLFADDYYTDPNGTVQLRRDNTSSQAFQAGNGDCFRLSGSNTETMYNVANNLIHYELYEPDDPAMGIIVHYYYGDNTGCSNNRRFDIVFICDAAIDNIPDSGETVIEPNTCEYSIEIKTIYGCPTECGRDSNDNICSNLGVCAYDFVQQTARCFCYAGYKGFACDETATFLAQKSWYDDYDAIQTDNESVVYEFETIYGFNVTYDLKYIVDGYLNDKYYKLQNEAGTDTIYFNLFDSFGTTVDKDLCVNNEITYEYGYIFQTTSDDPSAQCQSLGRNEPKIELYDDTLPTEGIKVTFENGEVTDSCSNGTKATIYFICPVSKQYERLVNGLNDEFSNYKFSELFECEREIEIFTSSACPFQCISYDPRKDMISECNGNGVCAFDSELNITRCLCNDNVNITKPDDILCETLDITFDPTQQPTEEPTIPPFIIDYYDNVRIDDTSDYLYTFETIYGYNITYDLQWIIKGYGDNNELYKVVYGGSAYYFNLFNKSIESNDLIGICEGNEASYEYGYVFQASDGNPSGLCYSLGTTAPNIDLYDVVNPSKGIKISYYNGDRLYCNKDRQSIINFICPDDGGEFERYSTTDNKLLLNNYRNDVSEPPGSCEYDINIYSSIACPAKCITYDSNQNIISVCKKNGICGYDDKLKLIKCDCNDDKPIIDMDDIFCSNENITYSPTESPTKSPSNNPTGIPTESPTLPPFIVDLYKNNKPNDTISPYIYTFDAGTYNISYDLRYIVNGYLNGKYYKLTDSGGTHNFYFNLFETTTGSNNVIGICGKSNPGDYEYGYIYQSYADDIDVQCYSLGRIGPNVQLYDTNNLLKGITISYESGDGYSCGDGKSRRTDINFICPDGNNDEYEIYDDNYGLNNIFASKYTFSEGPTCEYSVTIETAAACPYQCAYYDEDKPSISLCSTNGICVYDSVDTQFNAVKCQCDDGIIIDTKEDLYCAEDATYPPTGIPSTEPTEQPTYNPTRTRNPTSDPTAAPTETYGLMGKWNHYNPNDGISWQVKIEIDYHCEYVKFTIIIPICVNNDKMWFGFGIGGEYEQVESAKMNGYALITIANNKTFETTLSAATMPIPQTQQDLDCMVTINNCIQTNVCYRKLFDSDSNDFNEFESGDNRIAWAYGIIHDGDITYHYDNCQADKEDKIYLDGDKVCLLSSTTTSTEEPGSTKITTESSKEQQISDDNKTWMIVAIIFIILFIILLIVFLIFCYKQKNPMPQGYIHGRVQSTDGGVTQLTSIDDDDPESPKKEKQTNDTMNENDDLL